MTGTTHPTFLELDRAECEAILSRNHVGRLAFAHDNQPDIEPIHYVFEKGWIYGRTSSGTKMRTTGFSGWPVAFEVDEVDDVFRWRSVVVHGGFFTIPFHGVGPEVDEWKHAVKVMRTIVPETFKDDDPVSFRTIMFRIQLERVRGRAAIPPP